MRPRITSRLAGDRGTSAIEFALVFPAFLLLLLGLVEFGRALWTQSLIDYATQTAARCGAIDKNNCASSSEIVTYAVQHTAPLSIPQADFAASTQSCGSQVIATVPFSFVVPALFPFKLTLSAQACYPV